jgi:hypothetical protein
MDFTSGNKIQDNSLVKIFHGDQENIAQEKLVYIIVPVHNRRNLTLTCSIPLFSGHSRRWLNGWNQYRYS